MRQECSRGFKLYTCWLKKEKKKKRLVFWREGKDRKSYVINLVLDIFSMNFQVELFFQHWDTRVQEGKLRLEYSARRLPRVCRKTEFKGKLIWI